MSGSCELGNERMGSIKGGVCIDQVSKEYLCSVEIKRVCL
jgi:hypothetical protein